VRRTVAGTEAAIRGDGWQASLPRGSSDDRLVLHMYPIRGCKDFEGFVSSLRLQKMRCIKIGRNLNLCSRPTAP